MTWIMSPGNSSLTLEFRTPPSLKQIKYRNPTNILIEYQMSANDKSRCVSQQILYHYSGINNLQVELVGPTLKNKIWEPFSFYKRFLNKKNIIADSFVLSSEYGFEISDDDYVINFEKGEIKLNENVLPGTFQASFNYYPIYKSPYIQGAKWDASNLENYDGNTLWIEEVQDAEVFDGIMLDFNNDWDVLYRDCNWILDGTDTNDNFNTLDVAVDTLSFPGYTAYASPNDYKIVFSDDSNYNEDLIGTSTNFKVYDRTNNQELSYQFLGSQSQNEIDHLDRIYLFEDYFGNSMYTWNIEFTYFIKNPFTA